MKKIYILLLLITVLFSLFLFGCSNSSSKKEFTEVNTSETLTTESDTTSEALIEEITTTVYTETTLTENIINETIPEMAEEPTTLEPTSPNSSFVSNLNASNGLTQLIVVSATGSYATISMHEKINDIWTEILSVSGYVGSSGVGTASEGSRTTPQGLYPLTIAFGQQPNPGTSISYTQVNDSHYWVDDVNSAYYNQFVTTNDIPITWSSAEHLADASLSVPYAYVIAIGYNLDCIPGLGSAFFLHCSNGNPTYGCVSVDQASMIFILQHIQPGCKILIDNSYNISND